VNFTIPIPLSLHPENVIINSAAPDGQRGRTVVNVLASTPHEKSRWDETSQTDAKLRFLKKEFAVISKKLDSLKGKKMKEIRFVGENSWPRYDQPWILSSKQLFVLLTWSPFEDHRAYIIHTAFWKHLYYITFLHF
jgi:hypothetical protein